ncbi:Zinc finger RING/FYVE/PHD-type [Penicillium concentricum]|uniref:Zinc finger RING/FYVE/PHD-type n=1 Tax=Penicillium concentricum TaxID=293559 RepID=A0A9W9VL74_9EURO|nr:Zinc finger RING/FYVE/PHD-type [Penicillium concentricum]KAJ5383936.1 Zinc finger RING/FYVE/PHD-type [Penicillium concentricum]
MDQDTHQDTEFPILKLLLEDANDKIDRLEAQLLLNDTHQPANRLEEVEHGRGHSFVGRRGSKRDVVAQKNEDIRQILSTFTQKLVHSLKNLMRSIKILGSAESY